MGNLERLAVAVDRADYHDKAGQTLRLFGERLTKIPLSLPEMAASLLLYEESPTEVMAGTYFRDDPHSRRSSSKQHTKNEIKSNKKQKKVGGK